MKLNPDYKTEHKERPPWCNTKAAFELHFLNDYQE